MHGGPEHGEPLYAVRAVPVPEQFVRILRRRSMWLGLVTLPLSLVIAPVLLRWPYGLVPYGDPIRPGVVMFAGMAAFGMFGSGAMALGARACVKSGYLRFTDVRVTRAALAGLWFLTTIFALLAWGVLALVLSSPPDRYRQEVQFDASAWLYVLLLMLAVAASTACFFGLRNVLWRSPYVIRVGL